MKRHATKIVVFLLLGAIINVAVAWMCVTEPRIPGAERRNRSLVTGPWKRVSDQDRGWLSHHGWAGQNASDLVRYECNDAFNREIEFLEWGWDDSYGGPGEHIASRIWTGFPFRAMYAEDWLAFDNVKYYRSPEHRFTVERGYALVVWKTSLATMGRLRGIHDYRILPLCPSFPGFAINTISYAAILWALLAVPFAIRRRRRIKRGLCARCAYPVSAGGGAVCSECGTPVYGAAAPCNPCSQP